MLDGERPYVRSEYRQTSTHTHTRVYGMRIWRGRPHAAASESLTAKLNLYYFTNSKVLRFNSILTCLPNTNVKHLTLVRPM